MSFVYPCLVFEQPEELPLLQHALLDGDQRLVGVPPRRLDRHLLTAVEAPVHLPEAPHADHLLHVQLGEAEGEAEDRLNNKFNSVIIKYPCQL